MKTKTKNKAKAKTKATEPGAEMPFFLKVFRRLVKLGNLEKRLTFVFDVIIYPCQLGKRRYKKTERKK